MSHAVRLLAAGELRLLLSKRMNLRSLRSKLLALRRDLVCLSRYLHLLPLHFI
jgi:hypothetical protein